MSQRLSIEHFAPASLRSPFDWQGVSAPPPILSVRFASRSGQGGSDDGGGGGRRGAISRRLEGGSSARAGRPVGKIPESRDRSQSRSPSSSWWRRRRTRALAWQIAGTVISRAARDLGGGLAFDDVLLAPPGRLLEIGLHHLEGTVGQEPPILVIPIRAAGGRLFYSTSARSIAPIERRVRRRCRRHLLSVTVRSQPRAVFDESYSNSGILRMRTVSTSWTRIRPRPRGPAPCASPRGRRSAG